MGAPGSNGIDGIDGEPGASGPKGDEVCVHVGIHKRNTYAVTAAVLVHIHCLFCRVLVDFKEQGE